MSTHVFGTPYGLAYAGSRLYIHPDGPYVADVPAEFGPASLVIHADRGQAFTKAFADVVEGRATERFLPSLRDRDPQSDCYVESVADGGIAVMNGMGSDDVAAARLTKQEAADALAILRTRFPA